MSEQHEQKTAIKDECGQFMEALEEQLASRRPLDQSSSTTSDHSESCADCALFSAALSEFGRPPAVPRALITRASDAYFRKRARRRMTIAIAIPALAAAALLAIVLVPRLGPKLTPTIAAASALHFDVVSGKVRVGNTEQATVASGERVDIDVNTARLQLGSVLTVALGHKATLRTTRLDAADTALQLERGSGAFHLTPHQGMGLTVKTGWGRVVVTGTVFAVAVSRAELQLDVLRGSVRFEPRHGPPIDVHAGSCYTLSSRQTSPVSTARSIEILAALALEETPADRTIDRVRIAEIDRVTSPDADTEKSTDGVPSSSATPRERHSASAGKAVLESRQHQATTDVADKTVTPLPSSTADELIRIARRCRAEKNWSCAKKSYEQVIAFYPTSAEAATVLIPLGDLERDRLLRPGEALQHYEQYLRSYPTGPLAEEALYGKCLSLEALGRSQDELETQDEFLKRFPRSVYSLHAKTRLAKLRQQKL